MTEPTFLEVERLAIRLCETAGGKWSARYTKRSMWRERAKRFIEQQKQPNNLWRRLLRWLGIN